MWSGSTRAAVVRAAVSDPSELGQATTAMLKLLGVRAIAEPLSNWVGDMKLTGLGAASANEGAVQSVHVVRRPPKVQLQRDRDKPAESDAFDIVWSVDKQMFVGAAGKEAKAAYTSLTKGEPAATLGQDVFAKSVFTRLGPTLSFALVVDTARLGGEPAGKEKGSFVLAYGKDPKVDRSRLVRDRHAHQRAHELRVHGRSAARRRLSGQGPALAKPCLVPGTTKSFC